MNYILLIIFFITVNCSSNKSANIHGNINLDSKINEIVLNENNKNDLILKLGSPPLKSMFNDNEWYYVERKQANQSLFKLGKKKLVKNNILYVKFNNQGILVEKKLYDIDSMNIVDFEKKITLKEFDETSKTYRALSSLRERLNAPVKKRSRK